MIQDPASGHPLLSGRRLRPVLGPAALGLGLVTLVCVEGVVLRRQPALPHAVVWGSGLAVVLCALPWRHPGLTTRAAGAVAISGSVSLTLLVGQPPLHVWGLGEGLALLVLLSEVVRQATTRVAAVLAPLLGTAAIAVPLRDDDPSRFTLLVTALTAAVSAYSLVLRSAEAQRVRDLVDVRSAERAELARELHDVVAHHITGVVVLARAAGYTQLEREAAATVFTRIEHSAGETLSAMRRLVVLLRDGSAPTAPVAGLADLRELAETYSGTGPPVTLRVDPGLEDEVSPEVAAGVHRIAREALTNARKHGADATGVVIEVHRLVQAVQVTITDDGSRPDPLAAGSGGGFGLVGLTERAQALGGSLRAGPLPEGGWRVTATLPNRPR